jgi:hypothetical protein
VFGVNIALVILALASIGHGPAVSLAALGLAAAAVGWLLLRFGRDRP